MNSFRKNHWLIVQKYTARHLLQFNHVLAGITFLAQNLSDSLAIFLLPDLILDFSHN